MSVRDYYYNLLAFDTALANLGLPEAAWYPNFAPDSPAKDQRRFAVLRWGTSPERPARDRQTIGQRDLSVWVYNMEPNFAPIDAALKRVCELIQGSEAKSHGSGWIIGVTDNGASEDFQAPEYGREAVTRNWTYTITASES